MLLGSLQISKAGSILAMSIIDLVGWAAARRPACLSRRQRCRRRLLALAGHAVGAGLAVRSACAAAAPAWAATVQLPLGARPRTRRRPLSCRSCAAFFVYAAWLVYECRSKTAQADVSTVTIRDYSVWVRDLPEDCEPEELAEFMEQVGWARCWDGCPGAAAGQQPDACWREPACQWRAEGQAGSTAPRQPLPGWPVAQHGEVMSVELVRAYGQLLRLVMQRGELLAEMDKAKARLLLQARYAAAGEGGCRGLGCPGRTTASTPAAGMH